MQRAYLPRQRESFRTIAGCGTAYPIIQSADMGAEPTLMTATLPNAKPAVYHGPKGLMELCGHPWEAEIAPFAKDDAAALKLFDDLQKITGVTYDLNG